ncbi:hypothetical protein R1sor_000310 [Riccia sorocarpa]|uniref:Uncharacterized protein n=1 Tax=Riccia sorocarpa TaxID=122646 RepID=A0ABD3GT04_9MARC
MARQKQMASRNEKGKKRKGFIEIATLTLQRGGLRDIKEILLASDDVWQLFLKVADMWITCKLIQANGEADELVLPKPGDEDFRPGDEDFRDVMLKIEKNRKKMKANWFKPFQSMDAKDVKAILEMIHGKKLILCKGPKLEDPRDNLHVHCTWMKIEERLFDEVIRFFDVKFSQGFTRKELRRKYKVTRKFLKKTLSLLSEHDVAGLGRNVKWIACAVPTVLENKLIALYREATTKCFGERMVPYAIIETCGDLSSSKRRRWILEHAPTWNMVNHKALPMRGRVYPYYKRVEDIEELVDNWCRYRETIIDIIFSDMVVLRAELKESTEEADENAMNYEEVDETTTNFEVDENATNFEEAEENATNDDEAEKNATNNEEAKENATNDEEAKENAMNDEEAKKNATNDEEAKENATNDEEAEENATNDEKVEENATNNEEGEENAANDE